MKIRVLILCLALLPGTPLFGREGTDEIVMNNGDKLTGTVKGINAGVLYFSLPYAIETISIEWSKVVSLHSQQLFLLKMQDGSVYTGTINSALTTPGGPNKLEVVNSQGNQILIDSSQIGTVAQTSERFLKRFTGNVNFGVTYTKGNQTTTYNLSGFAAYPRERWIAQTSFSSNLSSSSGVTASTRNQANLSAFHLLPWKNYFYGGIGGFLQSAEQGINRQTSLGGGVGRFLKNTDHTTISLLGGVAWQGTSYRESTVPAGTQNIVAGLIATSVNLYRFNKTTLKVSAVLFPALSEPGRVFLNTNASYFVKITGNLSWNISFYGSWDNRPPGNLPGSDYGTSSGLTWTFGSNLRTGPRSTQ